MKTRIKTVNVELQKEMFGERFLVWINSKAGKRFVKFATVPEVLKIVSPDQLKDVQKNGVRIYSLDRKQFEKAFQGSNL